MVVERTRVIGAYKDARNGSSTDGAARVAAAATGQAVETVQAVIADEQRAFAEEVSRWVDPARARELLSMDGDHYVEWPVMLAWECWLTARTTGSAA